MGFTVEPVEGENYEGRQWGWHVVLDGRPVLDCSTGGTGPCWNIDCLQTTSVDPSDDVPMHVCDLDELISALTALRDSEAHAENVQRWA